ncbi:hypothetical protein AAF712_001903 [Marasmius tenuissimus]|uniref:Uncharacterized protein n=1 Tax=Marasmius tenuissimus TaxID=585030 RepID=A0ABR3A9R3_9AGAR
MRGRYLYFQCQQLILRKQVAALVRLLNIPPEIEVVSRDVWALHLSLLPDPPPAEPYHHARQQQDPNQSNEPSSARDDGSASATQNAPHDSSSDNGSDEGPHGPVQSDPEDPELAEILRQNSESESDSDEGDDEEVNKPETMSRRRKNHSVYEGPANNLAVLMIACWTLRIPLLYRDLSRYIERYELPYLDPVRLLPTDMISHLTKHNIQALSPAHAPNILALHSLTCRLARLMSSKYSLVTPEANAAPILWRATLSMGGTPPLYCLTKTLSRVLSLPLALHHSLVPELKRVKTSDPESHKFDDVPVELSFVAATIVVLKLVYGLDGSHRSPQDHNDPACVLPAPGEFLELVKKLDEGGSSKFGMGTSTDEMSDEAIDDYLSFCEHALLPSADHDRSGDKLLKNYFALAEPRETGRNQQKMPESRIPTRPKFNRTDVSTSDEKRVRPGESYTIHHSRDVTGTMNEEMELVVRRGAQWVGISEDYLCGVVEKYERRFARWWKETGSKLRA